MIMKLSKRELKEIIDLNDLIKPDDRFPSKDWENGFNQCVGRVIKILEKSLKKK